MPHTRRRSLPEYRAAPLPTRSCVKDPAVRIMDLEERTASEIDALIRLRTDIAAAISKVGNEEYETVLEMRYLL